MYFYDARAAIRGAARVLRPGGRMLQVVWGPAPRVWFVPVIELIETRAAYFSAVCPMMFFYGLPGVLPRMIEEAGMEPGGVNSIPGRMRSPMPPRPSRRRPRRAAGQALPQPPRRRRPGGGAPGDDRARRVACRARRGGDLAPRRRRRRRGHRARRRPRPAVTDVLIYGDTERSPELRHEVPVAIGDPILYMERDGRRIVLTNVLERNRVERAVLTSSSSWPTSSASTT